MKRAIRIIFMGTASFAVPTLEKLSNSGMEIAAVVTVPDKPAGRGRKIRYSPVKEFALENGFSLMQPQSLKEEAFVQRIKELAPDLLVVVAFRMLPEAVWKIPPKGTINLHASLLPRFRGAAPINHAIIKGETTTGLTTFLIDEEIDTGRILKQVQTPVGAAETAGELHDRLMILGADLTLNTIQEIMDGKIQPINQEELVGEGEQPLPAPKIFREDCEITWDQGIDQVYNFIRGLSPLPGAFTTLHLTDGSTRVMKVFRSDKILKKPNASPGTPLIGEATMEVACKDGFLALTELQLEGKQKMTVEAFLRGNNARNIIEMGKRKSAI